MKGSWQTLKELRFVFFSLQKSALLNVFIIEMNPGANVELARCDFYDSNDVINSSGKISGGAVAYKKHFSTLPMS